MQSRLILATAALLLMTVSARADVPLFEDSFTSPINTSLKWNIVSNKNNTSGTLTPDVMPVVAGFNDYAVRLYGNDGDYFDGLRSKQSFNRGNNLRVSFRLWKGASTTGPNHQWSFHGLSGPWASSTNFSMPAPRFDYPV